MTNILLFIKFEFKQSVQVGKLILNTFLISNNPALVPTSSSLSSSVRLTIVAPHARANLLLSDLRTLRTAEMFAYNSRRKHEIGIISVLLNCHFQ